MTLKSICRFSYGEVSFTGRMSTRDPGRKARMPFTMTVSPPLTLPLIVPWTTVPFFEGFLQFVPGREALRLIAREPGLAVAVLERLDRDADEVSGLRIDLAAVVAEFLGGDVALGLEPGVHHHEIVIDADYLRGNDFADAHFLAGEAFFE